MNKIKTLGLTAVIATLVVGCFDTSTNPSADEGAAKNGSIYGSWRFNWKNGNDSGRIDVTFFQNDSFSENATRSISDLSKGRTGRFIIRNDSLIMIRHSGSNPFFNYDSTEILRLDESALVIRYKRELSPFSMGFTKINTAVF